MYSLSALEYKIILKDISQIKGRFEKAYMQENRFRMKIGKYKISAILPFALYIGDNQEKGANFLSQKLRKELKGKWFEGAEQINDDRIIRFNFSEGYAIVFEMFGKGNIVLLKDNIILIALHERDWGTRSIRKGKTYVPPPRKQYTEKVAMLIARGLRKEWANKLKDLSDEEIEKKIEEFLNRKYDLKDKEIVEGKRNLSEVLEEYFLTNRQVNEEEERLKKRLEKQKAYLEELTKKANLFRQKANLILKNVSYVQQKIEEAKKQGKRKITLELD